MVEDYVPDRLEFELASHGRKDRRRTRRPRSRVDGRYLYGAPAAKLELEGEMSVSPASERPGFAGYQFGLADEDGRDAEQQPLERPAGDRRQRQGDVRRDARQAAGDRRARSRRSVTVRMAEPGGRAVERKLDAAGDAGGRR